MLVKNWKKEIFTIPNLLSLFRLALIPVYMNIYLNAKGPDDYTLAGLILAVSCLTDLLDGKIARKFNMITNLGKFLDPLCDKLTQLALIICLSSRYRALKYLLPFFLVKEFWQLFAMIGNLKKGKALDGALMSGKVSTTVLFATLVLMVLWPTMSEHVANVLTVICFIFLLIAFVDYILAYFGKEKKVRDVEV